MSHSADKSASILIRANRNEGGNDFEHPRDSQIGDKSHAAIGIVKIVRFGLLNAKYL